MAHDQMSVDIFKTLMTQQSGLTFLIGTTDAVRTFVMTAAGNSVAQLMVGRKICGFDVHRPDSFVPVPGFFYFQNPDNSMQIKQLIHGMWNEIENSPAKLVLLNGVWNTVPEIRGKIVACAKNRHVIVADQFDAGVPRRPNGRRLPCNIITVSSDANQRIHVLIQASGADR